MNDNNSSEEISCHHNSTRVIDRTCDENGINSINTESEAYFTCIQSIHGINDISMNDD